MRLRTQPHITGGLACLAAALFSFYDLLQFSLFNVISKNLLASFHLSNTELGLFSSSFLFANAIGVIFIGILFDYLTSRRIALMLLSSCVIACFILASTHNIEIAVLMRFIQGLASATSLLLTTRIATRWFPKKTAWVIGSMIAIALTGGMVGNMLFSPLSKLVGWREALYFVGYIGIAIFVIMFLFLFEKVAVPFDRTNTRLLLSNLKDACCNYLNITLGVYLGLMSLPIFVWGTLWGNIFLTSTYKITNNHAAMINGLLFLGLILGSPITGYLADKHLRRKTVLIYGTLMSVILMCLIISAPALSWTLLAIIFLMLGICTSSQNIAFAVIADGNPIIAVSTAIGIATFFTNVIGGLAQIGFGALLSM